MTALELLQSASRECENFRAQLAADTRALAEFTRRLEQISGQIHKNIEVRDSSFADEFNAFCLDLRTRVDQRETVWTAIRAGVRAWTKKDYEDGLALPAKGLNNKAKTLSRACDEFTTTYHIFYRGYKNYTAHKLNVWLLTSCCNDINNIAGKILFLAREAAKQAERCRG